MDLTLFVGFQWDKGNDAKNWLSHQVSKLEIEQVFFNEPLLIYFDDKHSEKEERYFLLGKTDNNRLLMVVFTQREYFIRVISARDMSKKEKLIYEKDT